MALTSVSANLDSSIHTPAVEYRPAIDGLRSIAVLAVFIFHLSRRWLPGGFVGVDIFFVVSGYLISSIILRDCERKRFSFVRFYQRRIARLLAAFLAVALATLVGAFFVYSDQDLASAGAALASAAGSVANLKFMLQGNYFVLSPDAQPFLHCWSLSLEEQFYLLFPAAFFLLYRYGNSYRTHILVIIGASSLVLCIGLTPTRPHWAFFLLPARAWELSAGAIIATSSTWKAWKPNGLNWLPSIGLAAIVISFFILSESASFPGYLATLPVFATACVLSPNNSSNNRVDRVLSWTPLVLVGRMSYSLYLWHWPVFSLVDYKFYFASPMFRVVLKVLITGMATVATFFIIEGPSRTFLNHPGRHKLAFVFLGCSLVTLALLGIAVRKSNYVNAETSDVASGGLIFNRAAKNGSMVLMGDSNGSMYGKMTKELAEDLDLKLNVISVAAGDPLPDSSGKPHALWTDSLAVVKRERPDFLVLVCNWKDKLKNDEDRLAIAVKELKKVAGVIILITQPPELPKLASRERIREGSRPPFIEELQERAARLESNRFLKSLETENVIVMDIEPLFVGDLGGVRFADEDGRQLYQDFSHLSSLGANLIKADLVNTLMQHKLMLRARIDRS